MTDPTVPIAFFAGVVSFLSPCVLPLVPGYLSYMSGMATANREQNLRVAPWAVAVAFVVGLGLVFMGALRVPFLYREARFRPSPQAGIGGSVLLGATFAFGWSPCIGATLGAVLAMAAGRGAAGGPAEGAFLLAVYSLGLGVPFIAAGLGVSKLAGAMRWFR